MTARSTRAIVSESVSQATVAEVAVILETAMLRKLIPTGSASAGSSSGLSHQAYLLVAPYSQPYRTASLERLMRCERQGVRPSRTSTDRIIGRFRLAATTDGDMRVFSSSLPIGLKPGRGPFDDNQQRARRACCLRRHAERRIKPDRLPR